jgi:SHS2 domain-containing protein
MKEHPTEATAIPAEKKVGHHISTEASDPTALLIDFLNEILTLAHVNKEAYTDIQWEKLSNTALNVIVRGVKVDAFDRDIKAVTFHQAEVRQNPNGIWETLLVFDI